MDARWVFPPPKKSFKKIADVNGWNVVTVQVPSATASDLSSVVQNLKTSQVEVLYSAAYVNDAILLMNQSAELGFDPAVVLGYGAGYTTPDIVNALGDRVNGIVAMDGAPIGIQDDLLPAGPTPSYSEFVKRYEAEFGACPSRARNYRIRRCHDLVPGRSLQDEEPPRRQGIP